MKTWLVTGGAGFIGSHFIRHVLAREADIRLVNLDALTYAGDPDNLADAVGDPRYVFVKGDIRDKDLVDWLFTRYAFDAVVHFAAESHVDRSIAEPELFLSVNVLGTQTLLEAAKRHWKTKPEDPRSRDYRPGVRFLQISTDEVYGALGESGRFTESSPLRPGNPYSASKAGADLMALAYFRTYGLPMIITRSCNNFGPCQFPEKLIPRMVRRALADEPLPVYGDGMQVRDWLHVSDHCAALSAVLEKGVPGEVYNISAGCEMTNIGLVKRILAELEKPESLIAHVPDRPGHDRRYALDSGKLASLGWKPACPFEKGLRETIRWYREHPVRGSAFPPADESL